MAATDGTAASSETTATSEPAATGETVPSVIVSGFYVADDGPGLPDDLDDDVFETSFSTSAEELGLGLWDVDEIAGAYDWTVTAAESSAGGARFEFSDVTVD